jgi:hypothetical protein
MKTLDIVIHLWRRSPRSGNCVYGFVSFIFIEEKTWIAYEKMALQVGFSNLFISLFGLLLPGFLFHPKGKRIFC